MPTVDNNLEKTIADMLRKKQKLRKEIDPDGYDDDITTVAGIDGADAYEFLMEYKSAFNIDMRDFIYRKYFSNEGLSFWQVFLGFLGQRGKASPLSIRQLAEIARLGKWPKESTPVGPLTEFSQQFRSQSSRPHHATLSSSLRS
jgi:hypothetical protein